MDILITKIKEKENPTVVGLDPCIEYVPDNIKQEVFEEDGINIESAVKAIEIFNFGLIDSVCDIVPAVKLQSAYYEMYGIYGIKAFIKTIDYAHSKGLYVICDVKRNDIGSTSAAYSKAYLGEAGLGENNVFKAFDADSITVNPYLGSDGLVPFIEDAKRFDKTIFALVKTSNPSSSEIQDLITDGVPVYQKVGALVDRLGKDNIGKFGYNRVGAVVGATYPKQAEILRKIMPNTYFLVPGYGAQGGTFEDVKVCFNEDGLGAIVNASRSVMCAYKKYSGLDFKEAAKTEVINMKKDLMNAWNK